MDYFAGFGHAISTYLAGVAVAHRSGIQLVYKPFAAGHGLGYAFDDLLASDPRGIVPPLAMPLLQFNETLRKHVIDGQPVAFWSLDTRNGTEVARKIDEMPPSTFLWLRKGWLRMEEVCSCSNETNVQYAGSLYQQYFVTSNEMRDAYITLATQIKIFASQSVTSSMSITASTRFVAWQRGSLPRHITHVGTQFFGQNYRLMSPGTWRTWPCAR